LRSGTLAINGGGGLYVDVHASELSITIRIETVAELLICFRTAVPRFRHRYVGRSIYQPGVSIHIASRVSVQHKATVFDHGDAIMLSGLCHRTLDSLRLSVI